MKSVRRLARVHLLLQPRKLLRLRLGVERPEVQAVLVAHRKRGAVAAAAAHLKQGELLLRAVLPVAEAQRVQLQRRVVAEVEPVVLQSAAPQFGEKVRTRRSLPALRR